MRPDSSYTNKERKDCLLAQVEQITPDVNLPGLKQKGKEASAIGKGGAKGDGAVDQVRPCTCTMPCTFTTHFYSM